MTREKRLEFCSICKNRKKDFQKGLLCNITGDYAKFEITCEDFEEDIDEKNYKLVRDLNASGHQDAGKSLEPSKNKENGALIFVVGVLILFITINYFDGSGILILPFGAIIYGVRTYLKGFEQEKVLERSKEFESKKKENLE